MPVQRNEDPFRAYARTKKDAVTVTVVSCAVARILHSGHRAEEARRELPKTSPEDVCAAIQASPSRSGHTTSGVSADDTPPRTEHPTVGK